MKRMTVGCLGAMLVAGGGALADESVDAYPDWRQKAFFQSTAHIMEGISRLLEVGKTALNGKLIHEGMFKGYHWTKRSYTHEFAIPAGTLKAGDNELVIRNDCAEICLCYVIIR